MLQETLHYTHYAKDKYHYDQHKTVLDDLLF